MYNEIIEEMKISGTCKISDKIGESKESYYRKNATDAVKVQSTGQMSEKKVELNKNERNRHFQNMINQSGLKSFF